MLQAFYVAIILLSKGIYGQQHAVSKHYSGKGVKRVAGTYSVPLETPVKYSQRDPLYDKDSYTNSSENYKDNLPDGSNNIASGPYNYNARYDPYQYYNEPEPIIEIIIKESNESLPTTQRPTLAPPSATKEPIHVFYVKYKKNPHKSDDVIYEPPVPALTPHVTEIIENKRDTGDHHIEDYSSTLAPPVTTTLRTIIRPDSEIYHGSGLKVTFETEVKDSTADRREESDNRESKESPKHHYFKRQPPPYHQIQSTQQSPQFTQANFKKNYPSLTQPSAQQGFRSPNENYRQQNGNGNYQRPVQFDKHHQNQQFDQSRLQNGFTPIQNNRQQQAPTPAQIEEYQKQKLFLHQQNLRQQALREQQILREQQPTHQVLREQLREQPPTHQVLREQPPTHQVLREQLREQPPTHQVLREQQPTHQVLREQPPTHQVLREQPPTHQVLREQPPTHQVLREQPPTHQVSLLSQKNHRSQLNIQPSIPVHYSRITQTPKERNPTQKFALNQPQYQSSTTQKPPINYAAHLRQSNSQINLRNNQIQSTPQTHPLQYISGQQFQKPSTQLTHFNQPSQSTQAFFKPPADGEIIKSVPKLEEHLVQSATNSAPLAQPAYNNVQYRYQQSNIHQNQQTSATTPRYQQTFNPYSTNSFVTTPTTTKTYSLVPSSTVPPKDVHQQSTKEPDHQPTKEENEKKKANLAALPEEVPADLREQLLSSGILGNADIQILDYDKVGDVPIESLPPEALENLYAAGSDPVPAIAPPPETDSKMNDQEIKTEEASKVEMKVVRFDPTTKEGQTLAETYVQEDATHLDPVVLNDSRYNRYLPLKIDGSQFPLPESEELQGRIVHSVVVLAPVDYDLLNGEPSRDGRASRVQGVRFLAGTALKTVVKEPSRKNYETWLEKERATPSDRQSVVLLVTKNQTEMDNEKSQLKPEIFMYDISHEKISKLKGELSAAFVQVAESNSGSDELEGLSDEPATSSSSK
ncbi:hypothetical protein O3M35_004015 [Rhynocoris fuscipes]|uniref:Uncharacterized protein n=1 Tax=Rhynocoris fuscipes TaxID=488301 RepID=A0AAW1CI99_9HEMI